MIKWFAIILIVITSVYALFDDKRPNSAPSYSQASLVPDQKLQPARQKLMNDMVKKGLFKRITAKSNSTTLVDVVTLPTFRLLDYDAKSTLLSPIFAYYVTEQRKRFDNAQVGVRLYDNMNGRKIGEYNGATLEMTN